MSLRWGLMSLLLQRGLGHLCAPSMGRKRWAEATGNLLTVRERASGVLQLFMAKWVAQEFSEAEHSVETLLVRPGESLPHKQALSAISGRPPGARTSQQGLSHIWHRGLAKATRSQARRWQVQQQLVQRDRWGSAAGSTYKVHTVLLPRYVLPVTSTGSVSSC